MQASYRFRFSEEHLLTSTLRYRQQIWWRRPFLDWKWLIGFIFLLGAAFAIYMKNGGAGAFCGGVLGALFLGWPIDAWILRWRMRKSPFHNVEFVIGLSDDGMHVVGGNTDSRNGWAVITKARRLHDGLLLFMGPHVFYWLPDAAAADAATVEMAHDLARAHVKDHKFA